MRAFYEQWWIDVSSEFSKSPVIVVGSDKQDPIEVTCHDGHVHDSKIPWNQNYISVAKKNSIGEIFTLEFEQDGAYTIEISRCPFE